MWTIIIDYIFKFTNGNMHQGQEQQQQQHQYQHHQHGEKIKHNPLVLPTKNLEN